MSRKGGYDINPIFIHTSYLINLAASDNDILEKSISLLIQEMDIADLVVIDTCHAFAAGYDIKK